MAEPQKIPAKSKKPDPDEVLEILEIALLRATSSDPEMVSEPVPMDEFKVDSLDKATWVVRKLKEAALSLAAAKLSAREYVERRKRALESVEAVLNPFLEMWAKENFSEGHKYADTPAGRVQFHDVPERLEVYDEDKFVEWADANQLEQFIRRKPSPVMDEINAAFKGVDVGALPPGVRRVPRRESMSIQ